MSEDSGRVEPCGMTFTKGCRGPPRSSVGSNARYGMQIGWLGGRARRLKTRCATFAGKKSQDGFVSGVAKHVLSGQQSLFGNLGCMQTPQELGGNGSFIERQVLSDCQRGLAAGGTPQEVVVEALAHVLKERSHADVRAAEPVLLPEGGQAQSGIAQMKADIGAVDYRSISAERLGLHKRLVPRATSLPPDENLLGKHPRRGS
jgi:hypothetical protein